MGSSGNMFLLTRPLRPLAPIPALIPSCGRVSSFAIRAHVCSDVTMCGTRGSVGRLLRRTGDGQELYSYYQLPFCRPENRETDNKRPSSLGEVLAGNELRNSGLDVKFRG